MITFLFRALFQGRKMKIKGAIVRNKTKKLPKLNFSYIWFNPWGTQKGRGCSSGI